MIISTNCQELCENDMHIQMKDKITINATADRAWEILAHQFGSIGEWASIITESKAVVDEGEADFNSVTGRVCTAKGFGDTVEELTHYDEESKCFTYKAIEGLPFFIKSAENNWSVHALSEEITEVRSRAEIEISFFPGFFLAPVFKYVMARKGKEMFEELKFYLEQGQPHPRKLKQSRNQ